MSELALSLIASLCVITLAVAIGAIWVAVRKAPPESNDALAVRVSSLHIEVEELRDAIDRWQKRGAVRDSRARAAQSPEEAQDAIASSRTGILRQPMLPGQRLIGGKSV